MVLAGRTTPPHAASLGRPAGFAGGTQTSAQTVRYGYRGGRAVLARRLPVAPGSPVFQPSQFARLSAIVEEHLADFQGSASSNRATSWV